MTTAITPLPGRTSTPIPSGNNPRIDPPRDLDHRADSWFELSEHRDELLAFLRRRCRDEHQAEDLAHDTLLRAARHQDGLQRIECLRAWLVQIAANVQRDHFRKESRHRLAPTDHPLFEQLVGSEPIPGDSVSTRVYSISERLIDGDELLDEVKDVLEGLSARDRRVLVRYYLEELSTHDAAALEETTPNLLKVWLFRARRRLESAVRRRVSGGGRLASTAACGR